jgi:hypothetical protein
MFWHRLKDWLAPRSESTVRRSASRQRFRPWIENLEERLAPAGVVTTTADNGAGSLRVALVGGGLVTFALPNPSTIQLTSGSLAITANTTIQGPGPGQVIVRGNGTFTDFLVNPGVRASITGLTITGGGSPSPGNESGGITNSGNLTLADDVISGNVSGPNPPAAGAAVAGGVANNNGAVLTVTDCTFDSNTGKADAGAIDNLGTLTVTNSTFEDNTGQTAGAIDNRDDTTNGFRGTFNISGSLFNSNNVGALDPAGAIRNQFTGTIDSCTLSGNTSGGAAGAIYNSATANLTITNSVLANNSNTSTLVGGAIQNNGILDIQFTLLTKNTAGQGAITNSGTLTINASQITGNTGIFGLAAGGISTSNTTTVLDSTIANNTNASGAGGIFISGTFVTTLINDTIANNTGSSGGGVEMFLANAGTGPTLNATNDTFAFNTGGAGAAINAGGNDILKLVNVLVNGNHNNGTGGISASGSSVTGSHVLIGDGTGSGLTNGVSGNIIGTPSSPVNALLAPLGYYGGPKFLDGTGLLTIGLLPGSPAINAGTTGAGVPPADERGLPRVGAPDIGAFESQGFVLTIVSGNNQQGLSGQPFTNPLVVQVVSNNPLEPVVGGQVTFSGPTGSSTQASVTFPGGLTSVMVTITSVNGSLTVGQASTTATAGSVPGAVAVVASIPGGFSVTFSLEIVEPILAVGADAGVLPEVKVYDAQTGALKFDFLAFASSFRGGVRVTVGDVEADGIFDIICAAGPGGGPEVRVFSGLTGALVQDFFAFTPTFAGGVYVAAGDVNGDGHADIICGAGATGGPQITVFSGANGAQLASFFAFPVFFTGGVRVAAGDLSGTGHADIIAGAGPGAAPEVAIYSGTTYLLESAFFAFPVNFAGGVYVAAGDLNHSGRASIVVGAGEGGLPQVNVFDGQSFQLASAFFGATPLQLKADQSLVSPGVRVAVDCEACPQPQIITGLSPFSSPQVDSFDAATLQLTSNFFAFNAVFQGGIFVGGA